ncbi:MAG: 30S ribosomal protein S6 [Bacilli bacterium]|nr:30S ribosomal protein S6 [Bacilli bacterium]
MRKYEIMFIVRPTLSEEEIKGVIKNFGDILTSNGAKIVLEKDMKQRELAYEIKNFKSGYYYVYNIEANDDKAINEFDRLALISKDIIRHLIIKQED